MIIGYRMDHFRFSLGKLELELLERIGYRSRETCIRACDTMETEPMGTRLLGAQSVGPGQWASQVLIERTRLLMHHFQGRLEFPEMHVPFL